MISTLQRLQFGFLYIPTLIISLIVYGSDFGELSGKLYTLPLFVIPLLHLFIRDKVEKINQGLFFYPVAFLGAIIGLYLSRELYFDVWDEHSVSQAALVSILAICSYFASLLASKLPNRWLERAGSFIFMAVTWLGAVYFPFIGFFAVSLIMFLSIIWRTADSSAESSEAEVRKHGHKLALSGFVFFLVSLDVFLVVWDLQVNSIWGLYLGLVFLGAAAGINIRLEVDKVRVWSFMLLVLGNFCLSLVWPDYLLHPVHAILAGILWGCVIRIVVLDRMAKARGAYIWVFWLLLALVFGYLFYANLALANFRVILVLPALWLLFMFWKTPRSNEHTA